MASPLAEAHIEAQRRLRAVLASIVRRLWAGLPAYNRDNIDEWLSGVVPTVLDFQRASVALTEAFVASVLERPPLGVDPDDLIGAAVRNGTSPEEVYSRPFVTLWSSLGDGKLFEDAYEQALNRAVSASAIDTQLSMRATAAAIERVDASIFGYKRAADPDACDFCRAVDGAYVKAADGYVMALHNHCGCGLEVLTEPHPRAVYLPDGTQIRPFQFGPLNDQVAVHEHGELGPVLASPLHDFTTAAQALA